MVDLFNRTIERHPDWVEGHVWAYVWNKMKDNGWSKNPRTGLWENYWRKQWNR